MIQTPHGICLWSTFSIFNFSWKELLSAWQYLFLFPKSSYGSFSTLKVCYLMNGWKSWRCLTMPKSIPTLEIKWAGSPLSSSCASCSGSKERCFTCTLFSQLSLRSFKHHFVTWSHHKWGEAIWAEAQRWKITFLTFSNFCSRNTFFAPCAGPTNQPSSHELWSPCLLVITDTWSR